MPIPSPTPRTQAEQLAALRVALAETRPARAPSLAFGVEDLDDRLAGGGLDGGALHEVAASTAQLTDDAAATLFIAGIAARFAAAPGSTVLWALTRFDLYAPALEQSGLGPTKVLYAQGRKDAEVLALAEDGLRDGGLACVVAEVKAANIVATRRLQLAAAEGATPMLLYHRHRTRDRCPLAQPSSAMTRWRIGCAPSAPLPYPGVGRARWNVELVRQRGGDPFALEVDACDDTGCLDLPPIPRDRAAAPKRAANEAA